MEWVGLSGVGLRFFEVGFYQSEQKRSREKFKGQIGKSLKALTKIKKVGLDLEKKMGADVDLDESGKSLRENLDLRD